MTSNPHDALFKYVFSQPEHAAGELQAVLDPALSARIDWETLSLCPGSFVDEALSQSYTDLLFSAQLDGQSALLYVLVEHLSTSQPLVPYRMLRYEVKIWDDWISKNSGADKLPAILPLVIHHSESGWHGATRLEDVIDVSPATLPIVAPHLPRFAVMLDDISKASDEGLRRRAMSVLGILALVLLRDARRPGGLGPTIHRFKDLVMAVRQAKNGPSVTGVLLRYILATSERQNRKTQDEIRGALENILGPPDEEIMSSLLEEGSEIFKEDGITLGLRRALLILIERRFGPPDSATRRRIDRADIPQLEIWVNGASTASSVAEALDGEPARASS